jgi:predicted permease
MTMSLPNNKFDWQHNVVFCRDVVNAIKTNPLVSDAAVVQGVPMRPGGFWGTFTVEGAPPAEPGNLPVARHRVISPDYFRVMRIPLLEGRDFDDGDGIGELGHPKFVIVNQALAARYWPGQSALGRRLNWGRPGRREAVTIAGVVADVRYAGLDKEPELEVYLPEMLFPQSAITLLVKTTTNPSRLIADIRGRIARIDREAFVTDVRTMDQLIGDSLASRWFATLLLAVCAALGLLLAVSGIFATAAQTVVQRRFEIGVRLALGATPRRVVRNMVLRVISPVAAGSVVGLAAMVAAAHLLSAMLFATQPLDPATFVEAGALFLGVSVIAAYVPARRASTVDPLVTLKWE